MIRARDFDLKDLDKICEFKAESARVSFSGHKIDKMTFKKALIRQAHKSPETIKVLESGNSVVGFIQFEAKKAFTGSHGLIESIFIENKYRRSGFGRKLMLLAEDYFRSKGIRKISCTVTMTNRPSIRLFKNLGYKEKRFVMEKEI